jgi:hypothetical protein
VTEYTFTARLAMLIGIDTVIAIGDSYIPQELSALRTLVAVVQLVFMAATMMVALRRVLEDY